MRDTTDETTRSLTWLLALVAVPWAIMAWAGPLLPHGLAVLRGDPLIAWQLEPSVMVPMILVLAIYIAGMRRAGPGGGALRHRLFFAGVAAVFIALESPVDALANHSLVAHQIEHMLLSTVAPLLLMLAQPQASLMRGLPGWLRRGVVAPMVGTRGVRGVFGVISRPMPATLLFIATNYFWMVPRFHDAALLNPPLHYLWHATLMISGLIFFFRLFDPRPAPHGPKLFTRFLMVWMMDMGDFALGFYLTMKRVPIYPVYAHFGLLWHQSAVLNERLGGMVMWIPSSMVVAISGIICVYRFALNEDRVEARRVASGPHRPLSPDDFMALRRTGNRKFAWGLVSFAAAVLVLIFSLAVGYEHTLNRTDSTPISRNGV